MSEASDKQGKKRDRQIDKYNKYDNQINKQTDKRMDRQKNWKKVCNITNQKFSDRKAGGALQNDLWYIFVSAEIIYDV